MKLGIISNAYNTGISHIGWGFADNFDSKTLIVDNKPFTKFPERFKENRITKDINQDDIDWLLDEIDCLLTIETPYSWGVYAQAKKKGIKTILMPMYEWLDRSRPELKNIDLFICPSTLTYNGISGDKVLVPTEVPVDLNKFKPRIVDKVGTFLHNSGHGGVNNRNSTPELLEAMKYVKSDVKLHVHSQYKIDIQATKTDLHIGNFENYWDLYHTGDVYVLLGKYGYFYLGIQEAAASGMPIIFSDMAPFNEYLPKELLVKPKNVISSNLFKGQSEQMAFFDPQEIARVLDNVCNMQLTEYGNIMLRLAKEWSWDTWKPKYETYFK